MSSEAFQAVVDIETTMRCPIGNNKANPFWPENEIVLMGARKIGGPDVGEVKVATYEGSRLKKLKFLAEKYPANLLVGHNIAFDLHTLLQKTEGPWNLGKLQIWDTQLAEYLLSGQQATYASLDECASRRGGTLKDERISIMFKAGKGADEVPRNMLEDYLDADLKNTETVFYSQYKEAADNGMLPLLWSQMDARLATIEMVNNGLAVDKEFLEKRSAELTTEVAALTLALNDTARAVCDGHLMEVTSPKQLSTVLFGGTVKWQEREEVGTYKNGKPKFKWVDKETKIKGYGYVPREDWDNANGSSTADEVLEEIRDNTIAGSPINNFVLNIQTLREKSKQLSTYFEGLQKLIFPDGRIHHNLNHCATKTGRLASSEPNLQNQTNGEIKKAFVSRWGEDGVVCEADYGQLEMVVLAVLSGDEQLLSDVASGIDIHSALYNDMHGRLPNKEERWYFKRCSFALIYGGGVGAIAAQGGTDKATAKRFITTFYHRYPGVQRYHEKMLALVSKLRVHDGGKDAETGLPIGKATYVSPLSPRRYVFREYVNTEEVAKWRGEKCGFSPQEIKNYPVQGGATGDIVPLVLGKLFRLLKNNPELRDKCLLVNTVHDSIELDVHKSVLPQALATIRSCMEKAPEYIKETFGSEFPMQLKVGISYGPNWFEQTELDEHNQERKAA